MHRSLSFLLAFVLFAAPAWAATVSDNFDGGTPGASIAGGNWDGGLSYTTQNDCTYSSGGNTATTAADGSSCVLTWNANSFASGQTAQITFNSIGGGGATFAYPGVLLKANAPATETWYQCKARFGDASAKTRILKTEAGSTTGSTLENSSGGWSAGDVLKCEFNPADSTVKAYKNGVLILTFTDGGAALTGSRVGITCISDVVAGCDINDFTGGDFAPVAAVMVKRRPISFQ